MKNATNQLDILHDQPRHHKHGEAVGIGPLEKRASIVKYSLSLVTHAVQNEDPSVVRTYEAQYGNGAVTTKYSVEYPSAAAQVAKPALAEVALPVTPNSNEVMIAEQPVMPPAPAIESAPVTEPATVAELIGNSALDLSAIQAQIRDSYPNDAPTSYSSHLEEHPRINYDANPLFNADVAAEPVYDAVDDALDASGYVDQDPQDNFEMAA